MSFEEKNSIISLFTAVVVFGSYGFYLSGQFAAGYYDSPDAFTRAGRTILWLIGTGIVVQILSHILFSILFAIVTNDPKPSFRVDERDRQISFRGSKVGYGFSGTGITASMVALAVGWDPVLVFNLVVFSIAAGNILECLVKVVLYRIGG